MRDQQKSRTISNKEISTDKRLKKKSSDIFLCHNPNSIKLYLENVRK